MSSSLADLRPNQPATVHSVDWETLGVQDTRRLREFGLDEGITVELLHRASLGGDPLACRIGRMTVAIRRRVAATIHVTLPA